MAVIARGQGQGVARGWPGDGQGWPGGGQGWPGGGQGWPGDGQGGVAREGWPGGCQRVAKGVARGGHKLKCRKDDMFEFRYNQIKCVHCKYVN